MTDEIEEKIRWIAEKSESAQGSHILADCDFSSYLLQVLNICEDFFPKLPCMMMSFNWKMTISDELLLHELGNYSQILHAVCNQANDKLTWSASAVALDCISYRYRSGEYKAADVLQGMMPYGQGNLVSVNLNGDLALDLGPTGDAIFAQEFPRGQLGFEPVPLPNNFPLAFQQINTKLSSNLGIYNFLEEFIQRPNHNNNLEDVNEARNYIQTIKENYQI